MAASAEAARPSNAMAKPITPAANALAVILIVPPVALLHASQSAATLPDNSWSACSLNRTLRAALKPIMRIHIV
jgi:hypothetical protein